MFSIEEYEMELEARCEVVYSKKEIAEANERWNDKVAAAVRNGSKLEIEEFTTGKGFFVRNFSLRLDNLTTMSISESQAVELCGWTV